MEFNKLKILSISVETKTSKEIWIMVFKIEFFTQLSLLYKFVVKYMAIKHKSNRKIPIYNLFLE